MKTHFVLLALVMYLLPDTSGNHTALGFGHDSLNSLNSEKAIQGKLN